MNLPHHTNHEEIFVKPKSGLLRSDGTTIICDSTRELIEAYEHDILRDPLKQVITAVSHAMQRVILFGGVISTIHDEHELVLVLREYIRSYGKSINDNSITIEDFFGNPRIQNDISTYILKCHQDDEAYNHLKPILDELQQASYEKISIFKGIVDSSIDIPHMYIALKNLMVRQDEFFTPQDVLLGIQAIVLSEQGSSVETRIQLLRHLQAFMQSFIPEYGKISKEGRTVKFSFEQITKKISSYRQSERK